MEEEILRSGCAHGGGNIDEEEYDEILKKECGSEREYKSLKNRKPQTEHVIRGYEGFSEDEATADLLEAGQDDMFDRPYENFAEYVMVPDMNDDENIVSGSES